MLAKRPRESAGRGIRWQGNPLAERSRSQPPNHRTLSGAEGYGGSLSFCRRGLGVFLALALS